MTSDETDEKAAAPDPMQDHDENVGATDADSVKGGFNPQGLGH